MKKIIRNENNTPIIICKSNSLIDDYLKEFIFSIIKNHNLEHKEIICKKIKDNAYNDIIFLNGKNIKKDQFKEVYTQFNTLGVEGYNFKFLCIDNIEDCSLNILNSFLKFFENPPSGLWIVLLTNNIYKILPTIRSRCIVTKQDELSFNIDLPEKWTTYSRNLLNAFSTKNEIYTFLENQIEEKIYEFLVLYKKLEKENYFKMLEIFKELDYFLILILFKMIYVFEDNQNIFDLINDINLNPNKTIMFYKLIEGKTNNEDHLCPSNT